MLSKSIISLFLVAFAVTLCTIYLITPSETSSSLRELQDFTEDPWDNTQKRKDWDHFKKKFEKSYSTMSQERAAFENWNKNTRTSKSSAHQTWVAGETPLSDLSESQFKEKLNLIIPEKADKIRNTVKSFTDGSGRSRGYGSPASVDWRTQGKVTPVKNQGGCGSCWAFATIGAIESLQMIQGGSVVDYSEQQLVDCSKDGQSIQGCSGGWPSAAMDWIQSNGITTEASYPYTGSDYDQSKCPNPNKNSFGIGGSVDIPSGDIEALKQAVSQQPVVVCIDASHWQSYTSGILNSCSAIPNHAVLLVGYTSEYWIIKNSWGTGWGEQGFIRLAMGNACGIANYASYPKKSEAPSPTPTPVPNTDDPRCVDYGWANQYYCTTNQWVQTNCAQACKKGGWI